MNKNNRMIEYIRSMKRIGGITFLLSLIILVTAIINPQFLSSYNIRNILRWTGLFGLLSLGAAFVVITGGIDLSIGSVVGLIGSIAAYLMVHAQWPVWVVLIFIIVLSATIGFQSVRFLASGRLPSAFWTDGQAPKFILNWSIPMPFILLLAIAVLMAIVLNKTIYGQHLKATGRNECASRFSGIHTDNVLIIAYVISSTLAGLGGLLFSLDLNTVQPSSMGNMYELYAIAGCVVGGVSLRGGDGSILGVILGTAIVRVLYNAINVAGVSTQLEQVVLGLVILIGVAADEVVRMIAAQRKVRESMILAQKALEKSKQAET